MIAVVGRLVAVPLPEGAVTGLGATVALVAAGRGARVELVGKVGDDPSGDAILNALSRAAVGHAAVLRDPSRPTPMAVEVPAGADPEDNPEWLADPDQVGLALADTPLGLGLEAADLELALRYLGDVTVIVLADPDSPPLVPVAVEAAAFAGAALVIVGDLEVLGGGDALLDATVLAPPAADPDGSFAALVAEYAVALDGGRSSTEAWTTATGRLGAERV